MPGHIYRSAYKDVSALTIENEVLQAIFLPEHGGKMASLIDRRSGREFLAQADDPAYKPLAFAGRYVDAECSGFDDMFPTIDEVVCRDYPWTGAVMPDHGEVCGLRWSAVIDGEALTLSTHGVRFPYTFRKRIYFSNVTELSLEYEVKNDSQFDLNCLWAAHLMLQAETGGQILLPYREGAPVTCVFSGDAGLGKTDDHWIWPYTRRQDGQMQDLAITPPRRTDGNSYKFYFDQKIPDRWVAYHYPTDQTTLKMRFPPASVPYLGIWINEGCFHDLYNIALEVCTATWDRPDTAMAHGQASILPAGGSWQWYLRLAI